ncbi:hypothetical protein BDN72DRAFT_847205, partial [Pluteus cervinus]
MNFTAKIAETTSFGTGNDTETAFNPRPESTGSGVAFTTCENTKDKIDKTRDDSPASHAILSSSCQPNRVLTLGDLLARANPLPKTSQNSKSPEPDMITFNIDIPGTLLRPDDNSEDTSAMISSLSNEFSAEPSDWNPPTSFNLTPDTHLTFDSDDFDVTMGVIPYPRPGGFSNGYPTIDLTSTTLNASDDHEDKFDYE